jgi:hypothetical protein
LRYAHFLSLAYVAFVLAGAAGGRLHGPVAALCALAGKQALAVFLSGLWLSVVGGYLLQKFGAGLPVAIIVNVAGIAVMVGVALLTGWVKSEPWRRGAKTDAVAAAARGALPGAM